MAQSYIVSKESDPWSDFTPLVTESYMKTYVRIPLCIIFTSE